MKATPNRSGFWWSTMGFTTTHMVGVFFTETLLCLLAMALATRALVVDDGWTIRLLLGALCAIGLAIAVLLASILSLLFYAAWPTPPQDNAKADPHADPFG